jgi:secondary thiamine-phosphate synthase enzyme
MGAMMSSCINFSAEIPVVTASELELADITAELQACVRRSGVKEGQVNLFVAGSTAGITTIEYEPGAISDLKRALRSWAPDEDHYEHNERWGDGNGRSHVRAALLGPSLTVPVRGGHPLLGTWQQVILVELDTRGRSRVVHVTVTGENAGKGD